MEQLQSELKQAAQELVQALTVKGLKVATAESCTGGWIAQAITSVSGSSACFDGGVVSYSNDVKQRLLTVSPISLQKHGAVSAEVVCEMAKGALCQMTADIAIATSGIAGPSGGSLEKPVGTVFIGIAQKNAAAVASKEYFSGDRDAIRAQAALLALRRALESVSHSANMG